jgi:hypothetical protein
LGLPNPIIFAAGQSGLSSPIGLARNFHGSDFELLEAGVDPVLGTSEVTTPLCWERTGEVKKHKIKGRIAIYTNHRVTFTF